METPNESAAKKPKRLTSVVWNHFERVRKADICYAVCVHCNKKLSGSSNSGTTHLRNHLMRCPKRSNFDVSQILSSKRRQKESNTVTVANINFDEGQRKDGYLKPTVLKCDHHAQRRDEIFSRGSGRFDQERSCLDLARMIIVHGYPLNMVDHVGFKVFVKNLQPLFEVVSNGVVEHSCMEIYGREKQRICHMMSKLRSRISLAMETWSSFDNVDYLCLTAHYIDEDWKMQKKVLNFVTLDSSYTKDMLPDVIIKRLLEWHIESKLFALTFDDGSLDNNIGFKIKDRVSQNKPFLSNDQLFDLRCVSHILKSIVQDAMEALQEVIQKVRGSVAYVKSSQLRRGKFNEIAQHAGISCQRSLVLDSSARWNSTCVMLETALEYKVVFCHLRDHDGEFNSALTDQEWEWTNSITGYLKLFFDITNTLSGHKGLTANIYFPEICDIHIQLIEWCKSQDSFLSSVAFSMKAKFDKYWSKCSLALAIAAILDPRFKMKLVEYYYSQIYGSNALDRIKEVSDGIKELYDAYSICSTVIEEGSVSPGSSLLNIVTDSKDRLKGFDKFLHENYQNHTTSDLDKYLEEPVFPRKCDFNILNWWRVHTPRYPILSMMARDVLGIPISTIAPEVAFDSGKRMLDSWKRSLNPDIREALICARDWLQIESNELLPSSSHYALPVSVEPI